MNPNFKPNEKELVRLVSFFKRKAEKLTAENKLDDSQKELIEACDKLVEKLEIVADNRARVIENRKRLNGIIQDNAECPKCARNSHLKMAGISTDVNGLKFNSYICKRCNIRFDWARPNNPWDLLKFIRQYIEGLEKEADKPGHAEAIEQMKANVATLEPVLEASDIEYNEMTAAESEMDKLVSSFKKQLQIEKIRLEN